MFLLLSPVTAPPVNGNSRVDEFRYPGWTEWLLDGHDNAWTHGVEAHRDFYAEDRLVK